MIRGGGIGNTVCGEADTADGRTATANARSATYLPVDGSFVSYTVTATNTSDTTKKTSLELDPGETEFEIRLIEGTYTLSVEGFLGEGESRKKILRGTYRNAASTPANTVTIDKEHPNPQVGKIYVNPFFDEGGTGTVSLKMNLSGCKIKSVKAVWKKQGADGTEKTATFDKGGSVLTEIFFGGLQSELEEYAFAFSESESTADIPSGIYEVAFSFYNDATQQDEVHKLFSCAHSLNVYQNLTTGWWKSSTAGATYISDGKFTLTQEIINRYIRHKFYVNSTSTSTLEEGTWYAPFKSVKIAVEKIRIINDGEPFTVILLSDDTDESVASYTSGNKAYIDIAPNTSLPLAVTILGKDGDDNDTLRTINAARDADADITGRVMYIGSKATVTLNNIGIAGGYSGDIYGGGIFNDGTLTITGNSKISGNTARSGGGVYVNSGTFTMNGGTISGNATTMHGGAIFVNKNAQATITDGATISGNTAMGSYGGSVYNFGTLEISNVTITGGYSYTGGGIYNTGTLTMTDSTISNCTATGYGAGFFNVGTSASATITNCTISGCTAETTTSYGGGGIYIGSGGTLSLDGCTIGGDSESDGCTASCGGGISLFGGTLTFIGSTTTIKNCTATTFGGGIYINTNNSAAISNCIIESCKITATSGTVGGGGIYNESGTAAAPVTITGCTIRQCTSEARGNGGGIYNKNGVLAISGGEISGCLSKTDGGGIFNTDATLSVNNTTISGCESGSRGGGIFNGSAATAAITDCTVESCSTSSDSGGGINNYGGTLTVSGGTVRNCTAEQAWGGGIFSTNIGGGTSVFTATGVTVSKCTAKGGGGIYTTTPSAMIDSCIITGCTATYPDYGSGGGGIYESGDGVTIKNCTIGGSGTGEGNTAAYGGGLYCNRTLTITGGTIIGNTATTNGGGMRTQQSSDVETRITLDGVTITKNTAERYGGGVYNFSNSAGKYPVLIMNGGEISQNSSGTNGGGIYNSGTFTMGGSASVPAGDDGKNDVYLASGKTIGIASELTAATPVATITPNAYTEGTAVLSAASGSTTTIAANYEKFAVTAESDGTQWLIAADGTLKSSVPEGFVRVNGGTITGTETWTPSSSVFVSGRSVTIRDMYVSDHEVTQEEYEAYCTYGSSSPGSTYGVGSNYPAYYVNWYDAVVYCNLRSIAEGLTPPRLQNGWRG